MKAPPLNIFQLLGPWQHHFFKNFLFSQVSLMILFWERCH